MILHIMPLDKFLPPFIDFIDENFGRNNHKYVFVTSPKFTHGLTPSHDVEFLHTDADIFSTLAGYMNDAEKIILHGLWRDKVDLILATHANLLRKCYWVMWGGDFYNLSEQHSIKREVIRQVGFLVTTATKDVELVRSEFGASGKHIRCLTYTSNIFKELNTTESSVSSPIRLLVGNSATPSNNHSSIFRQIASNQEKHQFQIFSPLSYGSMDYADEVISVGTSMFKNAFTALTDYLDYEEYLAFLASIDIAIFDNERQQAFGVSIQLLGLGKKLYLNENSSLHYEFNRLGIKTYSTKNIDLTPIDAHTKRRNIEVVKELFSLASYKKSLSSWVL